MNYLIPTPTLGEYRMVVTVLRALGYKDSVGSSEKTKDLLKGCHKDGYRNVIAYDNKTLSAGGTPSGWLKEISLQDFLALEAAKMTPPAPIKIRINYEYSAMVREDKSGVDVGCTFVSKDVVEKIYKALQ